MSAIRHNNPFRFVQVLEVVAWTVAGIVLSAPGLMAGEIPLELSTRSQVSHDGHVALSLTLKNPNSQPLFYIHPMFHFHHTMSRMPMIHRLNPGQSVTLENMYGR